jgi:hypothetical protein
MALACAAAFGMEYELSRHTVDGGCVMHTAGGRFELSGTIGQPDAGKLTALGYELTGGFWFGIVPGDGQEDGDVDLADYMEFIACMSGPTSGPLEVGCEQYDLDRNGRIDLGDLARFQDVFTGP